jgi:hypothetical protein
LKGVRGTRTKKKGTRGKDEEEREQKKRGTRGKDEEEREEEKRGQHFFLLV